MQATGLGRVSKKIMCGYGIRVFPAIAAGAAGCRSVVPAPSKWGTHISLRPFSSRTKRPRATSAPTPTPIHTHTTPRRPLSISASSIDSIAALLLVIPTVAMLVAALRAQGLRASRTAVPRASAITLARRGLETAADKSEPKDNVPEKADQPFKIRLHEDSFHGYHCDPPSTETEVTKNELMWMYDTMTTMRRMEQAADALYKSKLIRGFCHLAIGQEAVSVGMEAAITPEDKVITSYRCHTFAVLRGGTIKGVMAELMGREAGMSKGKGGSMHIFTDSFFGGNGIVGAQVPLGAGIAFAQKYLKKPTATFALYGDGASNQGQVFEAYNMAKLWNIPVVFVCENNKYGMGTSAERSSSNTQYFTRGDTIAGIQVNGMDILAVKKACEFAKDWAVAGKGPLLVEFVTYRYGGHSMSDPGTTYRTRDEVQQMRSANDPITGLKKYILEWGIADENELKALDKKAKDEVNEAVEEAKKSPMPGLHEFWTDVYNSAEPDYLRGRTKDEIHHYNK